MKRFLLSLLILGFTAALGACNTMEGVGEDVQEVGEEIEETADGR